DTCKMNNTMEAITNITDLRPFGKNLSEKGFSNEKPKTYFPFSKKVGFFQPCTTPPCSTPRTLTLPANPPVPRHRRTPSMTDQLRCRPRCPNFNAHQPQPSSTSASSWPRLRTSSTPTGIPA